MTRTARITAILSASAIALALAGPAAQAGVDVDPARTGVRPTTSEMLSAVELVYGPMADASHATLRMFACRPHGRIWRSCAVDVTGPGVRVRLRVQMTDLGADFAFCARPR